MIFLILSLILFGVYIWKQDIIFRHLENKLINGYDEECREFVKDYYKGSTLGDFVFPQKKENVYEIYVPIVLSLIFLSVSHIYLGGGRIQYGLLALSLICFSLISRFDFKYQLIPSNLFATLSLSLIWMFSFYPVNWSLNIFFTIIAFLLLQGMVFAASKFFNKDLLGEGDIKLITLFAFLIGHKIIFVVFLASILGLLYALLIKNKRIAFGPFIIFSFYSILTINSIYPNLF